MTPEWALGPFSAHGAALLAAQTEARFRCPVTGQLEAWAAKDVFNPAPL